MHPYARLIADTIGSDDTAALAVVEDIMRTDRTGLDGLSRPEFVALAREAHGDMRAMGAAGMLAGYCKARGLAVPARS
jgi:hypothetical protein